MHYRAYLINTYAAIQDFHQSSGMHTPETKVDTFQCTAVLSLPVYLYCSVHLIRMLDVRDLPMNARS